jgi:hypothetical protein
MREVRNAYNVSVEKPQEMNSLRRLRPRREENIEMVLKNTG